jgi:hypothetical protein
LVINVLQLAMYETTQSTSSFNSSIDGNAAVGLAQGLAGGTRDAELTVR